MKKINTFLLPIFIMAVFSVGNVMAKDCSYWHDIVGVKNVEYFGEKVNIKDTKKITEGIKCLLELEGIKSRGSFSGATHTQVSQLLPRASVEISALHYISYLFYEKFDYANGVALHEEEKPTVLNSKRIIKKAYKSYREWFEKVKIIGIEEARKQKLDPLKGSGVTWY